MLRECPMSDYQRKFSVVNFRKELALKVANRNATKTLKGFNIPYESGEQLHRIQQSGVT